MYPSFRNTGVIFAHILNAVMHIIYFDWSFLNAFVVANKINRLIKENQDQIFPPHTQFKIRTYTHYYLFHQSVFIIFIYIICCANRVRFLLPNCRWNESVSQKVVQIFNNILISNYIFYWLKRFNCKGRKKKTLKFSEANLCNVKTFTLKMREWISLLLFWFLHIVNKLSKKKKKKDLNQQCSVWVSNLSSQFPTEKKILIQL